MASCIPIESEWSLNRCISPMDEILTGITNLHESQPGNNGEEKGIPRSSNIQNWSLTLRYSLVWYLWQGIQSEYFKHRRKNETTYKKKRIITWCNLIEKRLTYSNDIAVSWCKQFDQRLTCLCACRIEKLMRKLSGFECLGRRIQYWYVGRKDERKWIC